MPCHDSSLVCADAENTVCLGPLAIKQSSEPKLVTLEPDGRSIDYRRFLQRYVLVQDASESVRLRISLNLQGVQKGF
jgi:hypothetical protein